MTEQEQSWLRRARIPVLIYLVSLGAYLGTSAGHLRKHSNDNHYVYLAHCLLKGRLAIEGSPPHQNDWALVTELELRDGRKLRGTFLKTGGPNRFKTTDGQRLTIDPAQIRRRNHRYYVSFPWFPALLMLPFVAIWGLKFNDVIFTAALAAFNPVLVYFVLRRLKSLGLSDRTLQENLWLVALFAFGTVHYFISVVGQVWFTAHVVGVGLTALYVLAALEGRHPIWAGVFLGLGFVTRTPIPFSVALLVGEVLRRNLAPPPEGSPPPDPCHRPPIIAWVRQLWPRVNWRESIRTLFLAAIPVVLIAALACLLNYLRFDNPLEFGHYYLNVRWTERIQRWGLFNYHFVPRNLAVMFTLGPKIMTSYPFVKISWHGLSLFLTTPLFVYLIWPRRRSPIQPWLYLAVLFPMLLHLFYQNSGWTQFGYRFSLDYTVYLIALLAIGGYRLGTLAKTLILFGIAVNTFGAITYYRYWQFYWDGMFPVG